MANGTIEIPIVTAKGIQSTLYEVREQYKKHEKKIDELINETREMKEKFSNQEIVVLSYMQSVNEWKKDVDELKIKVNNSYDDIRKSVRECDGHVKLHILEESVTDASSKKNRKREFKEKIAIAFFSVIGSATGLWIIQAMLGILK